MCSGRCIKLWNLLCIRTGYLFVNDEEVVAMVAKICPIAALYQFPDGILGCIGGVLRRAGPF